MDSFVKNFSGETQTDQQPQQPGHQQQPIQPSSGGGFMDKISAFAGGQQQQQLGEKTGGGGFTDKLNSMAGGGRESEKNEDALDKGVDWVQQHVMGQGDQSNESAMEQAKDEQISDMIRSKYKGMTGTDFPVKDKEKSYGNS